LRLAALEVQAVDIKLNEKVISSKQEDIGRVMGVLVDQAKGEVSYIVAAP
jgi:hypothetical protein